jgi:Zc3h12a-like Ribonuclease NYN domain
MRKHVVVDGSNLATEGRAMPSLKQLNDAVLSYMEDHPTDIITVVVDATFGHRIDPSEVRDFDAGVANNELVSPPAGAIGRGDAFVLSIANKAHATILSNDSFQEFHGEYPWLFDEGRLIGGKPVPHVGWVFVARSPVRGPVSRRAVKANKGKGREPAKASSRPSALASAPMPEPKVPPPVGRRTKASAAPRLPRRPRAPSRPHPLVTPPSTSCSPSSPSSSAIRSARSWPPPSSRTPRTVPTAPPKRPAATSRCGSWPILRRAAPGR